MNISLAFPADRPAVALITGPTASGKSALAMALARALATDGKPATIINADASQVYADLAILSARPTTEEMGDVPHILFGHVDGAAHYSAARWATEAKAAIADAVSAGRVPILVGGTGLYLRTLLHGIAPIPDIDPAVRAAVRALFVDDAYDALKAADPAGAARLNPADVTRIARALEVVRSSGRPLAEWQAETAGGISDAIRIAPAILLPPRDWLRDRCDARFEAMMDSGAVAEVEALLARKLPADMPVMRAIGVRDIAAWLAGDKARQDAIISAQAATRQYAKRQYTWLRHQLDSAWPRFEAQLSGDEILKIVTLLRERLLTA